MKYLMANIIFFSSKEVTKVINKDEYKRITKEEKNYQKILDTKSRYQFKKIMLFY